MIFGPGETRLPEAIVPAGRAASVSVDGDPVTVAADVLGPCGWAEVCRLSGPGVGRIPGSESASIVRARVSCDVESNVNVVIGVI
jgi:hypothetical protein